MQIGSLK